jgi:hypothetical protein
MAVIQEGVVPAPRPRLTPRELGYGEKLSKVTEDLKKNLSKTGEKLMQEPFRRDQGRHTGDEGV